MIRFTGAATAFLSLLPALPICVLSQQVDLGGGVVTRKDVQMYANLALDIRDIRASQDQDEILRLYLDGRNAEETTGVFFPLKKIGDKLNDETESMTPNYLFHLYGLAGLSTDDYKNSQHYSDRFIRSTITSNTDMTADAIVALDMWMYASHLLHRGVSLCSRRADADNPDQLEDLGGAGMDEFIALWIGAGQTPASAEGHSLYGWAQKAGTLFGTADPEAKVNEDLKLFYQQGVEVLSLPHVCTKEGDTTGVDQLWAVAQLMISKMHAPQIQMLIHALITENEQSAALYAISTIPQVAQCRPSVFKRLHEALLAGSINFSQKQTIFMDIELAMDCFGLTCLDIGNYHDGSYTCNAESASDTRALAGYKPSTKVNDYARIDQDILQLRILMSLDSWHFATYIYRLGRNSLRFRDSENDEYRFLSLQQMAIAADRRKSDPYYSYFVAYFNQVNYADVAVEEALRGEGKWSASVGQRKEVVVATCAFQIVFLYMLAELKETVRLCRDPNFSLEHEMMHPWDEVAALLIGSLEGTKEGGSADIADGQFTFNLANSRAFQFQTLSEEGYSAVSSDLEDLLFAGKGELDALDCDNLEKTTKRIEKLVIVPIVQSTLRYAAETKSVDSIEAALGEVFAFSVLPILSAADAASAELIRENMETREGISPVRDGAQQVADAFGAATTAWGLECHQLGFTSQADPCRLYGGHITKPKEYTKSSGFSQVAFLWLSGAMTAIALGWQLFN